MGEAEESALFKLTAHEADERLKQMFGAEAARAPLRIAVAAALVLAEAAAQRITLSVFKTMSVEKPSGDTELLPPGDVLENIERLTKFYFEGDNARIDLVLWDHEGYIFGWCTDGQGRSYVGHGSFPQTVNTLVQALHTLAVYDREWHGLIERHASTLAQALDKSRERAHGIAQERVASQSWLSKLRNPKSVSKEILSLGFAE